MLPADGFKVRPESKRKPRQIYPSNPHDYCLWSSDFAVLLLLHGAARNSNTPAPIALQAERGPLLGSGLGNVDAGGAPFELLKLLRCGFLKRFHGGIHRGLCEMD
jgi:hypothetical protein